MDKVTEAKRIAGLKKYPKKNFLSKPGEGLKYVRYRVLRPLLKLYTHWGRSKYNPAPWLTPAAIHIFDKILDKGMIGLEYGSGRSTYFFCTRLKYLNSVEHNSEWFQIVSDKVKSIENVTLTHIPPGENEQEQTKEFGIEGFEPKWEYREYFEHVSQYPDNHFDFVLIDGRARVECTINALPKIKTGGILALDNSERERYQPLFRILKDWTMVQTTNGLTNTTIWFKP